MKRILLALALVASPILAEEPKPIATQVGDAMRPAAEAYSNTMTRLVNEYFAGSKDVLGEAARAISKPKTNENAKPIAGFGAP
ncbi:hypothetical protein RTE98_00305 [Stutzerimonas frequens]|uniref:hypothetical protein n=1 Tax=Stutzerimonas frequens TaxID=2968969 RepID=UPI00293515BA|nr:hypothetical protein [Stutzerimonas frequens]WOC79005.1 hypothetical protein RTE98_00305 [Stutzerimonas frequens]